MRLFQGLRPFWQQFWAGMLLGTAVGLCGLMILLVILLIWQVTK